MGRLCPRQVPLCTVSACTCQRREKVMGGEGEGEVDGMGAVST